MAYRPPDSDPEKQIKRIHHEKAKFSSDIDDRVEQDTLGIDHISVPHSAYRSLMSKIGLSLFFALVFAIVFPNLSLGSNAIEQLIRTAGTNLIFIGGIMLFFGGMVDLGNLSPTLQALTRRYGAEKEFKTPDLNQAKSFYASGIILILLSFSVLVILNRL